MRDKNVLGSKRGVSEILGTVLVFSIAITVAVSLVAFGYVLVQDSSSSSDDRVAQDSLVTLSERVDGVTGDSLSGSTAWTTPEGTSNDFDARNDGRINFSITTNESYWTATSSTGSPGDLVDADNQTQSERITFGTIQHEAETGEVTAYQGGGLFRQSDDNVLVLQDPGIDVVDDRLQFDLIDVSSVDQVTNGEITLNQETTSINAERIQQIVNAAMQRDGRITAPANVNATVTSEYADGWATYAEDLDGVERVIRGEDSSDLSDNQIRIVFGEFGEGISPISGNFDDDILYTGLSEYAQDLYAPTEGEIEDHSSANGFNVTDPGSSDHMVGMLYEEPGSDSLEWYVWAPNSYGDNWVSAEEPNPRERVLGGPTVPDPVDSISSDGFEIENGTWVTAINTTGSPRTLDTFRSYLPNESAYDNTTNSNGILTNPVEVPDPGEQTGDYAPYLDIQNFDATVINSTTDNPATSSGPYEVGQYYVESGVTGENNGSADADSVPVALLWAKQANPDSPGFVNASYSDADIGDSFDLNGSYAPSDSAFYEFNAGTGQNKSTSTSTFEFFKPTLDGDFEVDITNVNDTDSDGDTVIEQNGDQVEITAEIENVDTSSAPVQQPITFGFDDGNTVGGLTVTLGGGDSTTETFAWVPKDGDADSADVSDFNVSSLDDYDTANVDIRDDDDVDANFTIDNLAYPSSVEVGEQLQVDFDVENTGSVSDRQGVTLRNASDGSVIDGANVQLDSSESTSLQLNWTAITDAAGSSYEFTLATNDNNRTFSTDVDSLVTNSTFDVEIVETSVGGTPASGVSIGQSIDANVSVTNTGDSATKAVWLENFDGDQTDVSDVTLNSGETTYETLSWDPRPDILSGSDSRTDDVTAKSPDTSDTKEIEVFAKDSAEPDFELSVDADSPVTEGEPLNVTVDVTNNGTADGGTNLVLKNIDSDAVDLGDTGEIATGDTVTRELTWFTLVGDANDDANATGDVTVEAENASASDEVTIEPREPTRPPLDVVYVLDQSGSMNWNDPDDIRLDATRLSTGSLNETKDQAAAVGYDWSTEWHQRLTSDFDALNSSLYNDAGGSTYINRGISQAEQELTSPRANPDANSIMIVLTDGRDSGGVDPSNRADLVDESITIHSVGLSSNVNEEELKDIKDGGSGEGEYRFASQPSDLVGIFEGIIDDATDTEPPEYQINDLSVDGSSSVEEGDTITVEADIENVGNTSSERPILLFDTGFNEFPVDGRLEEIDTGDTATNLQFEYNTTDAVDWSEEAGDSKTGDLTLKTPDEQDTVSVTVEEPPKPVFDVDITDTDDPVVASEENLTVDAEITNTGAAGGTQEIVLRRGDGSPTPVSTTETLSSSDSTNVSLTWDVPLRDASVGSVEVATDDNTDTQSVTINEPTGDESSEFEVSIEPSTDDEAVAGGIIDVDATVKNNGSTEDDIVATLYDPYGNAADAVRTNALTPGDSQTIDLSWTTTTSDAGLSGDIAVEAGSSRDNKTIQITSSDGDFLVENVSTNADQGVDSITENNRLEVETYITNNGDDASREIELLDQADNQKVLKTVFIPAGATERVELNLENADSSINTVTVDAQDDEMDQDVTINPISGPTTFNSITVDTNASSRADAVDAGEPIKVTVEIDATADETGVIVGVEASQASSDPNSIGWKKKDLTKSGMNTIEFIWDTRPRIGDDDNPWTVRGSALGESATDKTYIDEVDFIDPGDTDLGNDVPVGIDIDDIVIS